MSKDKEKRTHPKQIKGCDLIIAEKDGSTKLSIDGVDVTHGLVQYQMARTGDQGQSTIVVGLLVKSLNVDDELVKGVDTESLPLPGVG